MKILVVTGLLAADAVKKSVGDLADILVLPTPVAALITPQKLISGYKNSDFSNKKYDAVLVSGFSKFNFSKAENEIGSPVCLGPKHAVDLKTALLSEMFSKTVPACELIQTRKKEQVFEILKEHEQNETNAFHIGSVPIGGTSRMKILAEIVAAESLSKEELQAQVNYLISEGADIIDLGFSPDADEQAVSSVVSFVKSFCPIPISIDSGDFSQIRSGIENGVDLVLSVDGKILAEYGALLSRKDFTNYSANYQIFDRVTFVVIPDLFNSFDSSGLSDLSDSFDSSNLSGSFDSSDSSVLSDSSETGGGRLSKLESLEKNIANARNFGMNKIIADPILSPPGSDLFLSLQDYYDFHQRNPDIPVLFGVGNVTELFDADSVGMNALLSEIATECGASLLFTPNASDKGKGSVRELRTASEMMLLSNIRDSSPKDLGIDLLILKEKRKRPDFNLNLVSKSGAFDFLHLRDDEINEIENNFNENNYNENNYNEIGYGIKQGTGTGNADKQIQRENMSTRSAILSGALNPDFAAGTKWGWKSDPAGNFLIGVLSVSDLIPYLIHACGLDEISPEIQKLKSVQTSGQRVIIAVHQKAIIVGTDSAFMVESVLKENLISEFSHAAYLGRELMKAEIAVLLGRSYSQDDRF
ncbi:hypothetical protein MmiHf6_02320 [Methanimicrococcus hongohii]|uniref:Pterin-binding domain-containing protein n=1 Tax=Methanimicrococcus hongohii TaxID=3028295 RepID=A0AA96V0W3_9EURY|nr:DUF4346 domain-containing protein [Methanimicrococcus sp. Hf6]WNY22938.1 hypothetical protein MmiHf6_02320 [Methanimicrococcus sp. Hf6]